MRSESLQILLILLLAGLLAAGCGPRAAEPTSGHEPAQTTKQPSLPAWASENPSEEFLRAARILKPLPPELSGSGTKPGSAEAAMVERIPRTYPAAWEFFGTFSNEQIERFLTSKPDENVGNWKMLVLVESLTVKQRAAFDRYIEEWGKAMSGLQIPGMSSLDILVVLYKCGAKQDLSNVDVGFIVVGGHSVNFKTRVRRADGTVTESVGSTIATI